MFDDAKFDSAAKEESRDNAVPAQGAARAGEAQETSAQAPEQAAPQPRERKRYYPKH